MHILNLVPDGEGHFVARYNGNVIEFVTGTRVLGTIDWYWSLGTDDGGRWVQYYDDVVLHHQLTIANVDYDLDDDIGSALRIFIASAQLDMLRKSGDSVSADIVIRILKPIQMAPLDALDSYREITGAPCGIGGIEWLLDNKCNRCGALDHDALQPAESADYFFVDCEGAAVVHTPWDNFSLDDVRRFMVAA